MMNEAWDKIPTFRSLLEQPASFNFCLRGSEIIWVEDHRGPIASIFATTGMVG